MNPPKTVVQLLLLLQIVTVAYLWMVTLIDTLGAGRFATFLAIDLLSFSIVAYVYTHEKWGKETARGWILAGSLGLMVLLLFSLFFS